MSVGAQRIRNYYDAAGRLAKRDIAQTMMELASEASTMVGNAHAERLGVDEGLAGHFFVGAANIAQTAVRFNPHDPAARLLLGVLEWTVANTGGRGIARDVARARAAWVQVRCSIELAATAGDSGVAIGARAHVVNMEHWLFEFPRERDSVYIARSIRPLGYDNPNIAAVSGDYFVVIADERGSEDRYMIALERDGESTFALLLEPWELVGGDKPVKVEWSTLDSDTIVDGLLFETSGLADSEHTLTVYQLLDGQLAATHSNFVHTCDLTELIDLDGDGLKELLTHTMKPPVADCDDPCTRDIKERFSVEVGWPEVRRWGGEQWLLETGRYRDFYAHVSNRHDVVVRWLKDSADGRLCSHLLDVFEEWSVRAWRIAEGRN